ncbi:transposase, Ptta/En/Spm, plant, partial [Tanacetum coccineum]
GVPIVVPLFLCHWYDNEKCITVDGKHDLVDVNSKSKLGGNDPFVLAEQAYPSRKRSRSDWLALKIINPSNSEMDPDDEEEFMDEDEDEGDDGDDDDEDDGYYSSSSDNE